MGWPKGMPRKGHVNKNGTTHAHWGDKTRNQKPATMPTTKTAKRRGRPRKDGGEPDRKWNTKLTNKGLEVCPNCDFPEAYGGFCNECGWMRPVRYGRVA